MRKGVTSGSGAASPTDLAAFPRPSVAVDVTVFCVVDDRLNVVLRRRSGRTETGAWALPGSFVREREPLDRAVKRTLRDKCGIEGLSPTQLRVMDDPTRDARGWVLSVAHLDVVRASQIEARHAADEVRLAPVRADTGVLDGSLVELPDAQRRLPFDHEAIVGLALDELRLRYAERPDPYRLLGGTFTILELRRLHETVRGTSLQKDTFRRSMLRYLDVTEAVQDGVVGRPARVYQHRPRVSP